MTPELFIASKASEAIKALYNADIEPSALQVSVTRKEFTGDFTLVVFPLLRLSHSTPENTGNAIGEWLKANVPEISEYNCVKGFLNLLFSNLFWNELFGEIVADKDFGDLPTTGKNIMVEFSSPNTNKPLHLGHIRNNLLGDSVSRLLKASGACPPEDVGGAPGYEEVLEALADPDHEQHDDMVGWSGGSFDPEDARIDRIVERFDQLAKKWSPRPGKPKAPKPTP